MQKIIYMKLLILNVKLLHSTQQNLLQIAKTKTKNLMKKILIYSIFHA